ncbi:hypothetical protein HPB51_021477 [Rhipicephalus microplus]|uniref:Uncharacterized protein n=1 Tax=Rhipicephalus microplus TaxID=6941 RepID=A0A9J6DIJ3_RHIMP|nr:hypothetical protein HPB51_021477 [Rhipicephalus microplus]
MTTPDAIYIVERPKTPIDLTKLPPWQLYEAVLKAASLSDQPPAFRDKVRVHPTNCTFNLSVQESVRAQAYLRITSLKIGVRTIEFHGLSLTPSVPGSKKLAWAQGIPASLKASPTSSQDPQVGNLTQYIQSLEAKLEKTLEKSAATASEPMEADSSLSQSQSLPTESATAKIHARLERRERPPTFGQPATLQAGPKPGMAESGSVPH